MALYLGIDGGGTGCRAAVCDASGAILGEGFAGPANIASDPEGARGNILAAAAAALPRGADMAELVTVMGLAGANVPASAERLRKAVPFASVRIETDAMIALKGALRDRDGIVAAIGTGSVFASQSRSCGIEAGMEVRQIGGWGLVLGDEASGAWICRSLLSRALRATDGHVARTPLLDQLTQEFGGPAGIVTFAQSASPADLAAFAQRVTGSDDPAARAVMLAADAEVAAAVNLLQRQPPVPVVFLGGLGAIYAARLGARWPVAEPCGSALDGALWLARQEA